MFHRAGGRFRSETKWTREGVPAVLWIFLPVNREYNLKHAGRRAREVCFIADAERLSPRWGFAPFCGAPDARGHAYRSGHEVPFIAPGAFSAFWKLSGRGRVCLPFRARSAICRAMGFHRSAARRTREHAQRVSSRRMHSPFYTRAGRGSTRSVFHRAGCILRSVRMVDAGGGSCRSVAYSGSPFTNTQCLPRRHKVPFVAPWVLSVP